MSGVPTEAPVNTIAQDSQRPNYIYVGTKQSFYMSHDGGATWSRRGGNLPFGDFTSILINPRNGDEIFVGNAYQTGEIGGGVYRTDQWRAQPGRALIPKSIVCRVSEFGLWLLIREIKIRFSLDLTRRVFMLFRAVQIVCRRRASDR